MAPKNIMRFTTPTAFDSGLLELPVPCIDKHGVADARISRSRNFLFPNQNIALVRPGVLSNVSRSGVARPNPGRNYLYLRVSQKEPFDILYFTPALTVIANADDGSMSVTPELIYTGINDLELRARAVFLTGDSGSEFGERSNKRRFELRARLFF